MIVYLKSFAMNGFSLSVYVNVAHFILFGVFSDCFGGRG